MPMSDNAKFEGACTGVPFLATVHYGRSRKNIERYGIDLSTPSPVGTFGSGVYFLCNGAESATIYADEGIVFEVDLSFRNPFVFHVDDGEDWDDEFPGEQLAFALSIDAHPISGPNGRLGFGCEISDKLRELGHDGLLCIHPDGSAEAIALPHSLDSTMLQIRMLSAHPADNSI